MLRRGCAVLLALAFTLVAGCSSSDDDKAQEAREVAAAYLEAWAAGDISGAAGRTDDAAAAQTTLQAVATSMGFAPGALPLRAEVTDVEVTDDVTTATFSATWALAASPGWTYDGRLALVAGADDELVVDWAPSAIHPDLAAGETIEWSRSLPERASILDASGAPLFTTQPVVVVGVDPGRVTDLPLLAATLAGALGVSAETIVTNVSASQPGQFVTVTTLRRADYDAVRTTIRDLPGTVFREETRQLAPSARFGLGVLGRVGEATAEVLEQAGPDYATGDQLGLSGLQRAYQSELAGRPGVVVEAVASNDARRQLARVEPVPGTPIQVTLDSAIQQAADESVASRTEPTHLVVVRPGTGEVLAVSSNAAAANPVNALVGEYPAGSSFKIVTAAALMGNGVVTTDTPVACPGTVALGGREFKNEDRFDLGTVPFITAFAESCNTTMTTSALQLPAGALEAAATSFGIGASWSLPLDVFSGRVPPPSDDVELAANAIGQGRVLVSPFSMAVVAATAATGSVPVPSLVQGAAPAGTAPAAPAPEVVAALQQMMREVVVGGTGEALADRGDVAGKTGTAEFGTEVPPQAHGWFAGYRPDAAGGIAFAVLVEQGQSSKTSAVPVADTFLALLG